MFGKNELNEPNRTLIRFIIRLDNPALHMYIVRMSDIRFEWDIKKSRANKLKHNVSFEEAQTVFLDENALRFFDPEYSKEEDRFLMLGMSFTLRILVVCHCYREDDSIIRIISARKADKREQSAYWR
jgi:uncharacterized DUF497 family protein